MVIDLAETFLRPTAALQEPGSNMQEVGAHCRLGGSCVLSEAIRLSLMPWLLCLVLPLIVVVEKGGRITGLVVFMKYL